MGTTNSRIVGIDAALANTGWAVLDGEHLHDWGVIETTKGDGTADAEFERVRVLHDALCEVVYQNSCARRELPVVAIERTDWSRGHRDDRAAWVREARARGALGTGFATACCVCMEFEIKPHIVGAREWMKALDVKDKDGTAALVAISFRHQFKMDWEPLRRDPNRVIRTIRDLQGRIVPDHVTDAIAIALTLQRKLEFEARIANGFNG